MQHTFKNSVQKYAHICNSKPKYHKTLVKCNTSSGKVEESIRKVTVRYCQSTAKVQGRNGKVSRKYQKWVWTGQEMTLTSSGKVTEKNKNSAGKVPGN